MTDRDLLQLRAEMDRLNEDLCALLQRRARLCRTIAAHKRARGLPAADPGRETEMLGAVLAAAGDGFDRDELAAIFAAVFAASRALVQREFC